MTYALWILNWLGPHGIRVLAFHSLCFIHRVDEFESKQRFLIAIVVVVIAALYCRIGKAVCRRRRNPFERGSFGNLETRHQ